MRAAPKQANLQAVRRRGDRARASGDRARWSDHDMLAKDHIRLRKALEKPVVDHGLRAFRRLLSGLKDRHQRPAPCRARLGEQFGGADEPGHMHVMAAHMTDRHGLALSIGDRHLAGIGKPVASSTGSASISARSMTVGPSPLRSRPTTPVLPTPVVTS